MLSQLVRHVMERDKLLIAAPQTLVSEASRLMLERGTGVVVVVENERLIGIFSEHDALFRVIALGLDARTTRLLDVMSPAPPTVTPDRTLGYALTLMHEHGLRYLPVVEDGTPVGILFPRNALDPELEDFVCEARRRESFR
ncbi:MAG: CBS domain-containing protein [Caldimonas sp.]